MPVFRTFRHAVFTMIGLAILTLTASAAEPSKPVKWATDRVTSPETVEELKALQTRIKEVAKKPPPQRWAF